MLSYIKWRQEGEEVEKREQNKEDKKEQAVARVVLLGRSKAALDEQERAKERVTNVQSVIMK